ncbi:MAG: hypothetical protein HYU37_18890 [Acidobacteria bacterium]|nr:hypothetical protein [Acidobacteriota bacterium]
MTEKAGRTLIYVPVVHTPADLGGLATSVRRLRVRKQGRQVWSRSVDVVEHLWADIRTTVEGWALPWEHVRLYQDGLPVCGREEEIVRDLAKAGSPNHQLLLALMNKGARLMGTESPELLIEEYRLAKEVLTARDAEEAARLEAQHRTQSRSLIIQRDRFIAARINESLRAGETGLLFLGVLHAMTPHLQKDIRVAYPLYRPRRARQTAT